MGKIKRFIMHILCLQVSCSMVGDRKQIAVIRISRLDCMRGQREQHRSRLAWRFEESYMKEEVNLNLSWESI